MLLTLNWFLLLVEDLRFKSALYSRSRVKEYLPIVGLADFNKLSAKLILGADRYKRLIINVQIPCCSIKFFLFWVGHLFTWFHAWFTCLIQPSYSREPDYYCPMSVRNWLIESWRWIFGKALSWSKCLLVASPHASTIIWIFIQWTWPCLFFCSAQYTYPSQHGETTQKFSLWQGCLWKVTDIMIQQRVASTSKV